MGVGYKPKSLHAIYNKYINPKHDNLETYNFLQNAANSEKNYLSQKSGHFNKNMFIFYI